MGVVIPQVITEDRASGAQVIGGSLKFVSGSSHYLNRTPGSAGNRKTWTWSGWVKRCAFGSVDNCLFSAYGNGTQSAGIYFSNDTQNDSLEVRFGPYSGGWQGYLVTAQVFRDPSAWYHIVFVADTTQSTASDRLKLYINGSQVTTFNSSAYPSQNTDGFLNQAQEHQIGRLQGNTYYHNGYLAQVNFIDGTALTPSYFGFTDPLTNTWRPKKYTGTYGTNGFYLPMDNQNDFEIDKSGNGNDWTKGNFSGTSNNPDVLPDSPSGISYSTVSSAGITTVSQRKPTNWCTLNPAFRSSNSGNTYTDGNLVAINGTGGYSFIYNSTIPVSSGKWYAECTMSDYTGSPSPTIGIQDAGNKTDVGNELVGAATGDVGYDLKAGKIYKDANYNFATGYATATSGDTIGIKLDLDNNTIEFFKNGVSVGAAVAVTTGTGLKVFAGGQGDGSASIGCSFNWNFGQKPFKYNPPEGFKTLCLANLPRPTKAAVRPDKYFNTVLYTGDGNDGRTVTGVGFQPDFVWIKSRNNALSHSLYDSVRGVQKRLLTNLTNAESDRVSTGDGVVSFDADGFSLGADGNENRDTYTHVAWCWKSGGAAVENSDGSITSQVSANPTAGFSIVSYTGTGANATVGHGLGVAPKMIIVKDRDASVVWAVHHSDININNYLRLNTSDGEVAGLAVWNQTAPSSTVFSIGTSTIVNNTNDYIAYCFAEVEGYSKFGSYTGNGSTDGVFVFCGFRPRWIMVKTSSNAYGWAIHDTTRQTYNEDERILEPNTSGPEATNSAWGVDILSNGFKWRNDGEVFNFSGYTYIFAAFAEAPTNNLFGGQANAR
jgi:hypothetical protein